MRHLSFRTAQLLLLLAVLLTTAGVIGASAYYNARFAVDHLAAQVIDQTSGRIAQRVALLLDSTRAQASLDAALVAEGHLDPDDRAGLEAYFVAGLRAHPELSYLSFTGADNRYTHGYRDPTDGLMAMWLTPQPDGRVVSEEWRVGAHARELVHTDPDTGREQRTRPYYLAATAADGPVWTETYTFIGREGQLDVPGVTRATAVRRDGGVVGVLTADLDLRSLSSFLDEVPVGSNGFAFLVENRADGQERVIAHPDPTLLTRPDAEGKPEGVAMADMDDRVVRALSVAFDGATAGQRFRFHVDGQEWLGSRRVLSGDDLPPWSIAIVLPESDVMGPVHRMNRITFSVIAGGVGLALILGMLFSRVISRAVGEVTEEMHRIARFDLSGPPVDSGVGMISELHAMRQATDTTKQGLRSFGKYVPTELVDQLLRSGGEARLGAERRELTIAFTDIAGFTPIVEETDTDVLLEALGVYLESLNTELAAREGTVSQYLGDAIMAFWNAPVPQPDHALRACRAALAMRDRVHELMASADERGHPALPTRFGVNTGEVMVGNIGAPTRFNYNCLGDPVNTASRLEGLNKVYGTEILIGPRTAELVGDAVVLRPLDWVRVKGKQRALLVHELVGLPDDVDSRTRKGLAAYATGLAAYRAGDFDAAIDGFDGAHALLADTASRVLRDRCVRLRADPPRDWDGVFVMTRK